MERSEHLILAELGRRFDFPENIQINMDGCTGNITCDIAVRMEKQYEDRVIEEIAMEARAAGVASVFVLNKAAIIDALEKQIPTKPRKSGAGADLCPHCNRFIDRHEGRHGNIDIPHCKWCGQAIDWRPDNDRKGKTD